MVEMNGSMPTTADTIRAAGGDDRAYGGYGNDTIYGTGMTSSMASKTMTPSGVVLAMTSFLGATAMTTSEVVTAMIA